MGLSTHEMMEPSSPLVAPRTEVDVLIGEPPAHHSWHLLNSTILGSGGPVSAGSLLQPAKELGTDRSTALSSALKRSAENIDVQSPGKSADAKSLRSFSDAFGGGGPLMQRWPSRRSAAFTNERQAELARLQPAQAEAASWVKSAHAASAHAASIPLMQPPGVRRVSLASPPQPMPPQPMPPQPMPPQPMLSQPMPPQPMLSQPMLSQPKPDLPDDTKQLLRAFHSDDYCDSGAAAATNPDGALLQACHKALASVRSKTNVLGLSSWASLDAYHKKEEVYPTRMNETYTRLVDVVRNVLIGRGGMGCGSGSDGSQVDPPLRVGISGAAGGELSSVVHHGVKGRFEVYQSDLRPGQAPDVCGIDADGWPLDGVGRRISVGGTDVALARNCFYDLHCSFLTLLAMVGTLSPSGLLAVTVLTKQLGNVAAFLLESERVGVLTDITMEPIRLRSDQDSVDKGAYGAYLIRAKRTEVAHTEIKQLPVLLASTCATDGKGAALASALRSGLAVATMAEQMQNRLMSPPSVSARLKQAYVQVAAGEAVMRFTSTLSAEDREQLEVCAQRIGASNAHLTVASIMLGLRPDLELPARFEMLNKRRMQAAEKELPEKALEVLRWEPRDDFLGWPYEQLVDGLTSRPCFYFASVESKGCKVGVATNGVQDRYKGDPSVRAVPIVLAQASLAGSGSGGRSDTELSDATMLRTFAAEAIEALITAALAGGLGGAASMYGSPRTHGRAPGRTSSTFKPGLEGATPAQVKAVLKPGLVGATPAQVKATLNNALKPGLVGATPAQVKTSFKPGLVGATPAQVKASFKPGLEGATPAQKKAILTKLNTVTKPPVGHSMLIGGGAAVVDEVAAVDLLGPQVRRGDVIVYDAAASHSGTVNYYSVQSINGVKMNLGSRGRLGVKIVKKIHQL